MKKAVGRDRTIYLVLAIFVLFVLDAFYTFHLLAQKRQESLVLNVLAKQRAIVHKYGRDLFYYMLTESMEEVQQSILTFESNLTALLSGGVVSAGVTAVIRPVQSMSQEMRRLELEWKALKDIALEVIENSEKHNFQLEQFVKKIQEIEDLITETASQFSRESEKKLYYIKVNALVLAFVFGILLIISFFYHRKKQMLDNELYKYHNELEQMVQERTEQLKGAQDKLVALAREVGMAEVASSVLHNVGNVLNSVGLLVEETKKLNKGLRIESLGKTISLVEQHLQEGNHNTLLHPDNKIMLLLKKVGESLQDDNSLIATKLESLGRYVEHIGMIVLLQQRYSKGQSLTEVSNTRDIVQDAININQSGLDRHNAQLETLIEEIPLCVLDKHKVIQILINLISNAKYSFSDPRCSTLPGERLIKVVVKKIGDKLFFQVIDNGIGILPEHMNQIFNYGFTTRESGHGYGLHSAALAAQEMDGAITVHSDGENKGSCFTLELPFIEPALPAE